MHDEKEYVGDLILIRGLPGAGKTSLAEVICKPGDEHLEVDTYFIGKYSHEYEFDPDSLAENQKKCLRDCEKAMLKVRPLIVVSNNFTQEWELAPYLHLAEKLQYRAFTVIVEQRHNGEPVHDVPEEVLERMYERFSVRL